MGVVAGMADADLSGGGHFWRPGSPIPATAGDMKVLISYHRPRKQGHLCSSPQARRLTGS
jgi:hypothetical protein